MKIFRPLIFVALFASVSVISLSAQLVADGGSLAINGSTTNIAGNLTVGTSGSFTTLIITNGGTVSNTGNGTIGAGATANTNRVFVTGTNSLWANGGTLTVGSLGSSNQLYITNAARVTATNLIIGANPSSSSNLVNITGGTAIVTNAAGSGLIDVRGGMLRLSGGNVVTDYLSSTNSGGGLSNSVFQFNYGNLTTLHGSQIRHLADFGIGTIGGEIASWTMTGGTNLIVQGIFQSTKLGPFFGQRGFVTVNGASTVFSNTGPLHIGYGSSSNLMVISNGGNVVCSSGYLGTSSGTTDNEVWVTGPGSRWTCTDGLNVGNFAESSRMIVSNGGWLVTAGTMIASGNFYPSNNSVLVTGTGSVWSNSGTVYVGWGGSSNSTIVASNALLIAPGVAVSALSHTSNNVLQVLNGSLVLTNGFTNATLSTTAPSRGAVNFQGGSIRADIVLVNGLFFFGAGTLQTSSMTHSNGSVCTVGNGSSPATLELLGTNGHTFANGLLITNNALLKGGGTITGNVALAGALAPGASIGKLTILGSFACVAGSTNFFELNKSAATNDNLTANTLTYGGTLVVANTSGVLSTGDSFKLFTAPGYSGTFTNIQLPGLAPGLFWTNRLNIDGSIGVIGSTLAVTLTGVTKTSSGNFQFNFTNTAGGNYSAFASTNVAWPLAAWSNLGAVTEFSPGQYRFTDNQATNYSRRFYRVRSP